MLPLADIRVLAIEQFGAGPWATLQLAELGAEVVKVEDPAGGDLARHVPPHAQDGDSLYFETFNHNKRSVALDLKQPEARSVLEDLVEHVDALYANVRGDQPRALGLRYADLRHRNERLVCVTLTGFGTTGPRAAERAYDATVQALAGWMSLTGGPEEPPTRTGISLVDFSAGYVCALAILAGVHAARRSGVGCDADLSLFETALGLLNYMATWHLSRGWSPARLAASAHQTVVPFQAFEAADGALLVACPKETLWRRLCDALERPELAADERFAGLAKREAQRDELVPLLQDAFRARTVAEWEDRLSRHGVPFAPVNDLQAALADPQVAARDGLAAYDHPTLGSVRTVASALRVDGAPAEPRPAPRLGEDTRAVLAELCGYSEGRLEALARAGVFGPSG